MPLKTIITNLDSLKVCNTCSQEQPLNNYTTSATNQDGKKGKCKRCTSISRGNEPQTVETFKAKADYYIGLIYDYIDLLGVKNGDWLPKQAVMAAEIGIAATTLREAMAILQYNGHINSISGKGKTLISRPTPPTSEI